MSEARSVRPLRRDTLETRRQIVDAAEALFAEHGVDNVTLLDIARASGQKNRNAPQYHFGDKAGLINAVLDKHSDLISLRRRQMMAALVQNGPPTLKALVEVYVLPVARHVADSENNLTYLLIICQLMTSGAYAPLYADRADRYPELQQLRKLLTRTMTASGRAQREAKTLLIQTMVFHGLAGFYASGAKHGECFVRTLCASVEAVLALD